MPDDAVAMGDPIEAAKKIVNLVLLQAVKDRASEIHFDARKESPALRYRVNGEMREMMPAPGDLFPFMLRRIKFMANLQETTPPQAGRIILRVNNVEYVAALNTFATPYGERAELRLSSYSTSVPRG